MKNLVSINNRRPASTVSGIGSFVASFVSNRKIPTEFNAKIGKQCIFISNGSLDPTWVDWSRDTDSGPSWYWEGPSGLLIASDGALWTVGRFKKRDTVHTVRRTSDTSINWPVFWEGMYRIYTQTHTENVNPLYTDSRYKNIWFKTPIVLKK